jgi:hypothetical protein
MKSRLAAAVVLAAAFLLPQTARAGRLGTDIIGLFPKEVGELAYADLKAARKHKWFPQMKEQILPSRFRQFEQFLASAGIDPNTQVDELAWAASLVTGTGGEQIVGVALGQFQPQVAEDYFKAQKLPLTKFRGYTLFAFGSGVGPNDIFFLFLDSNTAAFGHRQLLEKMLDVRFGAEEGLLRNEKLFPLIDNVNGRGIIWAVLDKDYTRVAIAQLIPEAAQFPEAGVLLSKLQAMLISIEAERGLDAQFQAVCESPDVANVFAALLQAAVLLRRTVETESNPELAKLLEDMRVTPRGERLELRVAVTEEQMLALLRRNTFAVRM